MGIFQPTTPISAGAAQVFDTSGIVSLVEQQKANRLEQERYRYAQNQKNLDRLMKSKREFDPEGIDTRDIPKFKQKVQAYEKYLSDNHHNLASSSPSIETVQKKRAMENDIREFVAGAKKFNTDMNVQRNLVLQNPRYDTPANRQLLSDAINKPSDEAYDNYTAFKVAEAQPHYNLEPEKYVKAVENVKMTKQQVGEAPGVMSTDFYTTKDEFYYDPDKVAKALAPFWGVTYNADGSPIENPNPTYQELEVRERYKTMENFVVASIAAAEKEGDISNVRKTREPSAKALSTMEKNAPIRVQGFHTQGSTSAIVETRAAGFLRDAQYADQTQEGAVLNYSSDRAWATPSAKGIELPGDIGGFDVSAGVYKQNLGKDIVNINANYMAYQDYATQPVYAAIEVPGRDGEMVRTVKRINAGALIPNEGSVELYRYGDDVKIGDIISKKDTKNLLDSKDGPRKGDYISNDLFVFATAYEAAQAYNTERETTELKFGVFGTSKSQWAFKYNNVKHLVDPKIKRFYPEAMDEILKAGYNSNDPNDPNSPEYRGNSIIEEMFNQ